MSARGSARLRRSRLCLAPLLLCSALSRGACGAGPVDASGDVIDWEYRIRRGAPPRVPLRWALLPAGQFFALVDGQNSRSFRVSGRSPPRGRLRDRPTAYAETQTVYPDLRRPSSRAPTASQSLSTANSAGNMGFGALESDHPHHFRENQAAHYADRAATIVAQLTLGLQCESDPRHKQDETALQYLPLRIL